MLFRSSFEAGSKVLVVEGRHVLGGFARTDTVDTVDHESYTYGIYDGRTNCLERVAMG